VLAGIIQILAGLFKLGKLMRIVPHPVIYGFVNGLAIIYFMSQLNQFKDASGNWLTGQSLYILVGLVLLTMLIIWSYQAYKSYPCFINCNFAVFEL
jgi:SulP family sulfate permease